MAATICDDSSTQLQLPLPVLSTTLALVRSVAVHSMNTSRVSRLMAECAPLMMGGRLRISGRRALPHAPERQR